MNIPLLLQGEAPCESSWAIVDGLRRVRISGNGPDDILDFVIMIGRTTETKRFSRTNEFTLSKSVRRIKVKFVEGPSTIDVDLVE